MRTPKRDVARIYLVTGLSIVLLTVCFFLFGLLPLNRLLRDAHARGVYYFLENNAQLVNVVIEKHIDIARQMASRTMIRHALRDYDIAARHGGEEFAILLPHTAKRGALDLAERLRAGAQALAVDADGRTIQFTVSLGVTSYDPARGKRSSREVVSAVDQALYASKGSGRNRVSCAES